MKLVHNISKHILLKVDVQCFWVNDGERLSKSFIFGGRSTTPKLTVKITQIVLFFTRQAHLPLPARPTRSKKEYKNSWHPHPEALEPLAFCSWTVIVVFTMSVDSTRFGGFMDGPVDAKMWRLSQLVFIHVSS